MNSIKQGSNHTINLISKISRHAESSSTQKNNLSTTQLSTLPSNQNSRGGNYNLLALVSLIKRLISQVSKEAQKEKTPQLETHIKRNENPSKNFCDASNQAPKKNDGKLHTEKKTKEDNQG